MPIFEKSGIRLYFCHIPKTAGIAVYCAFVESGWTISNVTERHSDHSAFTLLNRRYGIQSIPQNGHTFRYKHSVQHAPAFLWRTWGAFDDSFAIIRDPFERFLSSMRYRYKYSSNKHVCFEDYVDQVLKKISRNHLHLYTKFDGHLIPQHWFVSHSTFLYLYEDEWQKNLIERYNLLPNTLREENKSDKYEFSDNVKWLEWIRRFYKYDYKLLRKIPRD